MGAILLARARPGAAGLALVGLGAVVDPVLAHRGLHAFAPPDFFRFRPPIVDALRKESATRVYVDDYRGLRDRSQTVLGRPSAHRLSANMADGPAPLGSGLALRESLIPPVGTVWGLRYGFDLDQTGLQPRETTQVCHLLRVIEGSDVHSRLLQLGGVSHAVTMHALGLERVSMFGEALADPVLLWRVPRPLPRVRVVGGVRVASGQAALRALVEPAFDPERQVVLTEGADHTPPPGFAARVEAIDERPGMLGAVVETTDAGFLVVTDSHDPGWQATLDGARVPVLRANHAFRAVPVPPGRHRVELRYVPPGLRAGFAIAVPVALLLFGFAVRRRNERFAAAAGRETGG